MFKILKEFKEFAMRGNVIDLAVGVIIGGAFGKIVTSIVNDLFMPLLSVLTGGVNFVELKHVITPATDTVKEVALTYGAFIQSVINFLIIAFSIFMFIKLLSKFKKKQPDVVAVPVVNNEELLLKEIRDILKEKNTQV